MRAAGDRFGKRAPKHDRGKRLQKRGSLISPLSVIVAVELGRGLLLGKTTFIVNLTIHLHNITITKAWWTEGVGKG